MIVYAANFDCDIIIKNQLILGMVDNACIQELFYLSITRNYVMREYLCDVQNVVRTNTLNEITCFVTDSYNITWKFTVNSFFA